MRNLTKLLAAVGILGMAGVANAGKSASIDDLFASANSKASSSKHVAAAPRAKVTKAKPAMQPRMAAAAKAPNRAPKASDAPAPTAAAPTAPAAAPSNTMVLADYAPERHALAGP